MAYRGSCLCGTIVYEVEKFQPHMAHCHCSMCRKFHGAAFSTFGAVRHEDLRWLQGEENLQSYVADNQTVRQFCKTCGSSLTFRSASSSGQGLEIALGSLDDPIDERPDAHIYLADGAHWYETDAPLLTYKKGRK